MPLSNVSEHMYDCCHCSNHSSAFGCFLCSFGDMLLRLPEISIGGSSCNSIRINLNHRYGGIHYMILYWILVKFLMIMSVSYVLGMGIAAFEQWFGWDFMAFKIMCWKAPWTPVRM